MTRLLVLAAAALIGAGCAGGDDKESAADGLHEFLVAVSEGDRSAAAERVSGSSNLTDVDVLERVPRGVEIPPADDYAVLREGPVTVVATELESEFGAYAAPVTSEEDKWKVAFASDELRIVEGPPAPRGGVGPDQRVGFAVYSDDPDVTAALWIDGEKQQLAGAGGPEFTRYWSTPELAPGTHTAVALARARGEEAAVGWTFTAGLPG
ncbi:MAG TPA: hypothetical protein VFL41_03765 [Gaiellaceae bacterium]|nr:hypothetical protein [Gaiellaceae bacterium]